MPNGYDLGTLVRAAGTWTASGNTRVDPASVYLQVRAPGGAITTYGYGAGLVQRATTGCYYGDILGATPGPWHYRFVGTPSTGLGAGESTFQIQTSNFV